MGDGLGDDASSVVYTPTEGDLYDARKRRLPASSPSRDKYNTSNPVTRAYAKGKVSITPKIRGYKVS